MQANNNLDLIHRFVRLPLAQRELFYQKLQSKGLSLSQLPIPVTRLEVVAPELSYAQQRQWFLWQLEPDGAAYHIPAALRLVGELDREALARSFAALIARHESLRTTFAEDGERVHQVIHPHLFFDLPVERLAAVDEANIQDRISAELRQPFDLRNGPLLRVRLLQLGEQEHVLVLVLHHIVADGWSMPIMVEELVRLYAGYSRRCEETLPALPIQYADYALWQRAWMEAGERERQLAYWREQLGGEQPLLELPIDRSRTARQSHAGARLEIALETDLVQGLKQLAQQQGVTLFMLLLASFQLLLQRYSGQDDIRVGVPMANRTRVETEGLIGFFVNTLVLKASFKPNMTFVDLLQQVKRVSLEAQAHQDLPFEQLVEALQPERSLSHNPLFQVMYTHQGLQRRGSHELPGLHVENLRWQGQTTQFDLMLDSYETDEGLGASLIYAIDLFDKTTAERLVGHWLNLLSSLIRQPSRRIAELPLMDEGARQQVLRDWNRGYVRHPGEHCLHELIEDQVRRAPDAIAAVLGEQLLSYDELNCRANRLAHHLLSLGVGPDVRVGIAMERDLDMLVGLLAILKAGGAYVPLDPTYPRERLAYLLEDSGVRLLLTQMQQLSQLSLPEQVQALCLDRDATQWHDCSETNPQSGAGPDNLAYVIYTSGSTGKPKGALLAHRNVVRLFSATEHWFGFDAQDVWTLFHSYAFDFSVWEIFGALLHGGRLVIVPWEISRAPQTFHDLLIRERVTVLNQTPSAFKQLMSAVCAASSAEQSLSLRYVIFGGEALEIRTLRPWFDRFGDRAPRLVNMYGITETTVHVTHRPIELADLERPATSPIGEVIPDLSWYVLDSEGNPIVPGCTGELYVGQAGLARGYHLRPDLTAERFVPDPFDPEGGSRLYRTGDLARYRGDGVIDYVGRIDHQVKIRGFRIELGEIEACLQKQEEVREVVVLPKEGAGGQQMVAYVVPRAAEMLTNQQNLGALRETLRAALRQSLPEYMVPAFLLLLDSLPLTSNGKLDHKTLPLPDVSEWQQEYVVPVTPQEREVAAIWAQVLKVERVGLTDNFFELGGHSLLATQVVARVRQQMDVELPLRSLFEAQDVASFAALVGQTGRCRVPGLQPVGRSQPLALSYAQQRQWFLWQLEPDSAAYHIPAALRLTGRLDLEALRRSFATLVERHETLRTTFAEVDGQATQVIHPQMPLDLELEHLDGSDERTLRARIEEEIRRPFDLCQGPLLRIRLLRLAEDEHVLVLVLHHIVSDGWSTPIMVDELIQLYAAYSEGREARLPALPIQYADYALWQRAWMEAGERERQLSYWQAQLEGEQPVLELPVDHPRPAVQSYAGASLEIQLGSELAESLKQLAQRQGVTLFMLLLASFQALLHRYSGQDDIRVGVPIANRTRVETEGLIGFFVNTQVLKAEFAPALTFEGLLQRIKRTALDAQAHQDLPFEQLVEALQPERSLSHSPLFQVLYNHQREASGEARQLPGLRVETLAAQNDTTQFDLVLNSCEIRNGLWASLTYATDLFYPATIERLAGHWRNLLEAVCAQPELTVAELCLLDDWEHRQIVEDWNCTRAEFPLEMSVSALIEEQVRGNPDAVALVFGERNLTYAELNRRANRLAHYLRGVGVGPDVLVGIAMERSLELVVGLLAILKAGGAYVPLDPDYPQERLAYMLEDSGVRLLLTQQALQGRLPVPTEVQVLCLDAGEEWLEGYGEGDPQLETHPANLAYVIYTSGSTGRPKGVAITHGGLSNHMQWMRGRLAPQQSDRILQKTSCAFDASVWEFWLPLLIGARLHLADPGLMKDPAAIWSVVEQQGITILQLAPSLLQAVAPLASRERLRSLRLLCCGGEALAAAVVRQITEHWDGILVNLYGPTEATIDTCWQIARSDNRSAIVSIGRPIDNLRVHVLDNVLGCCPVGGIGELHIGGAGLARGYHGKPALTAERFVPDPLGDEGTRLYRSGDLARYHIDGSIDYQGRTDHQVKIRGFRIELGEIEARLREQQEVREAVVLACEGAGGLQLVAYVVPMATPEEGLPERLHAVLRSGLPEFMVPTHFLLLDALPLTQNGKLDRKALPQVDVSQRQSIYVAPESELQQRLAAIWAQVLKLERVGLTDNFFELGGHSLLMTQVMVRIREQLGMDVALKLLFEQPTLEAFSHAVERLAPVRESVQGELAKSLDALKRLTSEEIDELIS